MPAASSTTRATRCRAGCTASASRSSTPCRNRCPSKSGATEGLPAELYARRAGRHDLEVAGTTKRRGTKLTFKPDAEIFETVVYSFDTLAHRLRELAFLNAGVRITLDDERDGREEPRLLLRGRHQLVRAVSEQEPGGGQRRAHLHAGRARRASMPRSRCSGTTVTRTRCTPSPTTSIPRRAARTCRGFERP